MKRLMLNRLLTYENVTSPILEFQFGTPEQLHRAVSFALEALEKMEYSVATFLDIQKAFDRVWHPVKAKSFYTTTVPAREKLPRKTRFPHIC